MSPQDRIRVPLEKFITRASGIVSKLSAETMINDSAINPFLAKALGFEDFDSLARFYVYQRVGRSLVTSFGMVLEHVVKAIIDGEKGDWWDVVKLSGKRHYYISVKSGPRDMNKDQTMEFSRRAKKEMKSNKKAYPLIGMAYGKKVWPVIVDTLKKQGLDPKKHALAGKDLYQELTGDKNFHKKLLELVVKVESEEIGGKTILDLLDEKVEEISNDFKKKYKNVDELLADTF